METIDRSLLTFLLNSLWQVPLIAGVAALAVWWMRTGPARHRHVVWVAALIASVVLPLASLRPQPATRLKTYALPKPFVLPAELSNTAAPARASPAAPRTVPIGPGLAMLLLAAYGAFLIFRVARLAWAGWRTVSIRRSSQVCDAQGAVARVWARCSAALGTTGVELLVSEKEAGPAATGLWRGSIVLPAGLMAEESEAVLTAAIGHEMAHIARRDFGVNLFYEVIAVPLSFHPALIVIRRGIAGTREMACDELVAECLMEPSAYAQSILTIATGMAAPRRLGYTLGVFDADILEERIQRLLHWRAPNLKRARALLVAGLAALAICIAIGSGLAISARAQTPSQTAIQQGIAAYNAGNVPQAAAYFETAVTLEPKNVKARLHLANANIRLYMTQPPELRKGIIDQNPLLTSALQQYEAALQLDPDSAPAAFGIVALTPTKALERNRQLMLHVIATNPRNKDAYYTLGSLDWMIVYPKVNEARQAAGMSVTDVQIPNPNTRGQLRTLYGQQVEEGISKLQTAIRLDPQHSEALAFLNLMDRLKAMLVDSSQQSQELTASADGFVWQALHARRDRAAQPPQPDRLNADDEAPAPFPSMMLAPPPPPPPPPPGQRGDGDGRPPVPPPPPPPGGGR